jgi:hypothetical protein
MSLQRTAYRLVTGVALMLLGSPALALAQWAAPNVVLHEVTEVMKIRKKGQVGVRQATAALMGTMTAGTSLCPDALTTAMGMAGCGVTAYASDRIDLATGKGPMKGKFAVVVHGDNPVDGPEAVVARGDIEGTIDLSPALSGQAPMGFLVGRWYGRGERHGPLHGLKVGGTVTGTFRLPFDGGPWGPLYLDSVMAPVPVAANELSLGVPTVKLELFMSETAVTQNEDDD